MTQVLTVSCKLKVSQSQAAKLDATLDAFVQALNWVNQNTPEKVTNAVKLQSLCYREIRARFGLSSNLAQQVCRRLAGARKVARQKNRPVKAFSSINRGTRHCPVFLAKREETCIVGNEPTLELFNWTVALSRHFASACHPSAHLLSQVTAC